MTETDGKSSTPPRFGAQFESASSIAAIVEAAPGVTVAEARRDLARLLVLADQYNALSDALISVTSDPAAAPFEKSSTALARVLEFLLAANGGRPGPEHTPLVDLLGALVELGDGGRPALFDLPSRVSPPDIL